MKRSFRHQLTTTLLSGWAVVSSLLQPGFGPGVSGGMQLPLQEQGYWYRDETALEYEKALDQKKRERRKKDVLFESFYQREKDRLK